MSFNQRCPHGKHALEHCPECRQHQDYPLRLPAAPPPAENDLRLRLHNYGVANWVGRSTTTHAQQLQIAQACVDALDQFDKYEAEIERLDRERAEWASIAATRNLNIVTIAEERDAERVKRQSIELELDAALMKLQGLNGLLSKAADDIDAWGGYAMPHFQEKHDLKGCVARYRTALDVPAEPEFKCKWPHCSCALNKCKAYGL